MNIRAQLASRAARFLHQHVVTRLLDLSERVDGIVATLEEVGT